MIPRYQKLAVATSGMTETKSFTIEANAIAFRSLIDGLYSNKIAAVIRELTTNAFDSHRARGNADRPCEIHLPSLLEPSFYVRDYGTSMDHDKVMGLYSTLFSSSKRESNTETGMLGLGSKAFYAYTASAFVICYLDGIERMYSCYLDEDGIPTIAKMFEGPTDEEQGIKVEVPVKIEDIKRFREEAQTSLFGFEPRPTVLNEDFQWEISDASMTGNGWRYYSGLKRTFALQGGVLYPIDTNQISGLYGTQGLVMEFPIGSLSVATSREHLSYDVETKKALVDKLAAIKAEITAKMEASLAQCPTYLDACVNYEQIYNNLGYGLTGRSALYWKDRRVETRPYSFDNLQGYRFVAGPADQARDQRLAWRVTMSYGTPTASELKTYTFLHEPPGCDRVAARVRALIANGTLKQATVVVWCRGAFKVDGLNYIDLSTVDPIKPRPAERGPKGEKIEKPKLEGIFGRKVTAGLRVDQNFVPFDGMLVAPHSSVDSISVIPGQNPIDHLYLATLIRQGENAEVLPRGTGVYLLNDVMKRRLDEAGIKYVDFATHMRTLLKEKFSLSHCHYRAASRGYNFTVAQTLVNGLPEKAELSDDLAEFVTKMAGYAKTPQNSAGRDLVNFFVRDLLPEDDPWTKEDLWNNLNKKLPLLAHIPAEQFNYYLKLEGKLK